MELENVIVLILMAGAALFLILAQRNSRQNEARIKAQAAVKGNATSQAGPASEPKARGSVKPPARKAS
jgi:hypothetical protein